MSSRLALLTGVILIALAMQAEPTTQIIGYLWGGLHLFAGALLWNKSA